MKRLTLLLAVFLSFLPFLTKAETGVKVDTPSGSIEVRKDPPPQPVIVVQPQSPQKIVVEQQAPPPPSGGSGCNLLTSSVSASGLLSLVPVFSSLFLLSRWRRRCGSVSRR